MAKRGPKFKLNDALRRNICKYIEAGVPIMHAASINGIDKSTFYDWYNKGKAAEEGMFREFYLDVEEAKSVAIGLRVSRIYQAGESDWKADAWWLERVCPEDFARKDRFRVDANAHVESKSFDNLLNAFRESKREWIKKKETVDSSS